MASHGSDPDAMISYSDFFFFSVFFLFIGFFSNPGGVLAGFETRDIGRQWNNGGKVGLSSLQPLLLPG